MEVAARTGPELGVGGEVIDDSTITKRSADRGGVADVGLDNVDPVEGEMVERCARAIHDANTFPSRNQKLYQMRANEPRTAGDDRDAAHAAFFV
jgi:hypothetical protein